MTGAAEFGFTDESVPTSYDEFLVPRLFNPWAEALVHRLAPEPGLRALDVACGPGTVARVLARSLGPKGIVAASDSSPAMITRAESKGAIEGGAPIAYTVSPAAPLPYPDQSFDVVTCQQGLQFFPDARAALTEMRRVLTPRGRLGLSVWCPPEDCSVFFAFQQALRLADLPELADFMNVPFPRWTGEDLAGRARGVGFQSAGVVDETHDLVFEGGVAETLRAFSGTPIGPMLTKLTAAEMAGLVRAADQTLAPLMAGGTVRGPMRSWILEATA